MSYVIVMLFTYDSYECCDIIGVFDRNGASVFMLTVDATKYAVAADMEDHHSLCHVDHYLFLPVGVNTSIDWKDPFS